jgi:uncharacterized protein (DUF433 family)
VSYQNIITTQPGKRGGRSTIRGMRIAVTDVLGWLAAGMTPEETLSDYPELTEGDIRACLDFAADDCGPTRSSGDSVPSYRSDREHSI